MKETSRTAHACAGKTFVRAHSPVHSSCSGVQLFCAAGTLQSARSHGCGASQTAIERARASFARAIMLNAFGKAVALPVSQT